MLRTRRLLREEITYSAAKEREVNILHQLSYYDQQHHFLTDLDQKRHWIKTVVVHHLGIRSSDACHVAEMKDWLHGSFNVCVPVTIDHWKGKQPGRRVLLRFPLPYRVGEAFQPGNGDEKIRCEAGTYAWLQKHCAEVPIPQLYGFAVSTGETFTRLDSLPFPTWCFESLRRRLSSWLGREGPSNYVRHQGGGQLADGVVKAGYLLLEYIEETQGMMLSNTWPDNQHDVKLRTNLFRDLSRILLSFSRIPLPRIASFTIDNNGLLRLTNRPLSIELQALENENIPTDIPRDYTYTTVGSYLTDMLALHDSRFRNQPNAVNNLKDCGYQLSALAIMRTIWPSIFQRNFRRGPFIFTLTDLHQSNIFVDENWNITSLVDLEWACSRPIEMTEIPYWLTNKGVDQIVAEEYDVARADFMASMRAEEQRSNRTATADVSSRVTLPPLSDVMEHTWETGTFWYTLALSSPTALFSLLYKQILPIFVKNISQDALDIMPFLWDKDVGRIAGGKLSDKERYDMQLRQAFEDSEIFKGDVPFPRDKDAGKTAGGKLLDKEKHDIEPEQASEDSPLTD